MTRYDIQGRTAVDQRPGEVDPQRRRQARQYARQRRRLWLAELTLGAAAAAVFLLSGGSAALRDRVSGPDTAQLQAVAVYALVVGVAWALLVAPLQLYGGYVLPRRYGLGRQGLGGWLLDRAKLALLGGAFSLLVVELVYALLRTTPQWWWLWTGLVLLAVSTLLSGLAPVLLFPLFFRFEPLKDRELVRRLERLARDAGTGVRGVYRFDMSRKRAEANAALAGLGRTRRIVLADTLLDQFTSDEIETVLAHELGHHVHGDLGKGIAVSAVVTLGGLYLASQALAIGTSRLGLDGAADVAGLPLLALVMGAFSLVSMPLNNTWSRWRERKADHYALQATGKPQAFRDAMLRLAGLNLAEIEPPRWVEVVLMSHPAIGRRLEMARKFE
jgi:STE24 endopeptidase